MKAFTFQMPTKIIFREGATEELPTLVQTLLLPEKHRVLLVSSRRNAATPEFLRIVTSLQQAGLDCIVYKDAVPEPTVKDIDHAATTLRQDSPGVIIAVGGGSVIDTAKALALLAVNGGSIRDYLFGGSRTICTSPLPLIAVPTTAGSGSEVTAASVIDDGEQQSKLSVTDQRLIPCYAVIDPNLHVGMPQAVTASTGMDALTHAIEAYVSKNANPVSDAYAEKCIQLVGQHLLSAVKDGTNLEARGGMALAAVLGAAAYLNAGLGAVHGISQSTAAIAHTPHGVTNAILLPHVMSLNLPGNPLKFAEIARLLGADVGGRSLDDAAWSSVSVVKGVLAATGLPGSLATLNVHENQFEKIADATVSYRLLPLNPVPVTRSDVLSILQSAF